MASVTVYSATKILELLAQAVVNATKTVRGIVELATTAEVLAGTDDERAVTPLGVKAATDAMLTTVGETIASTDLATMSSGTALDGYVPAADGLGGILWEQATGGGLGEVRHDYVAPYSYVGVAPAGSAEASSVWTLTRITVTASGTTTTGVAAGASWTNRESETYL